jgi:protein-S-isoprenylcysteine O-methyltransferase Ste14
MNITSWFSSPLQSALFYGSLITWTATELVNTLVIGRHRRGGHRKDRGSYFGVSIAINLAFVLMLLMRSLGLGLLPTLFQWGGLAMVWAGGLVREWAILNLGRAFTVVVEVNPTQSLIRSGPYRWVRHPAYTGILILLGGFGLAVGSWLGAILAMAVTLAGFSYRVRVEERAMLEAFGDDYRNYMHHTGRYLPRVLYDHPKSVID